jgi:hypothetical protein
MQQLARQLEDEARPLLALGRISGRGSSPVEREHGEDGGDGEGEEHERDARVTEV